jgi:cytochrome c-type biogenesis protein CcmE
MAQATWEKPLSSEPAAGQKKSPRARGRWKFLVGGLLILAAVGYLVVSGTVFGARYYIGVGDLVNNPSQYAGQPVRVSGAVLGDSIVYDSENLIITFTVAHVTEPYTDLGQALHDAVYNPNAVRMNVRVENEVMPELLQNEAQAIMTGTLGDDGIFHVSELNLKCPSRFIENQPDQSIADPGV